MVIEEAEKVEKRRKASIVESYESGDPLLAALHEPHTDIGAHVVDCRNEVTTREKKEYVIDAIGHHWICYPGYYLALFCDSLHCLKSFYEPYPGSGTGL